MEVILTKDVDGVGKMGNVIKVKDGYAHNFLFPKKLALPASTGNLKKLEQEKNKRQLEQEKIKKECVKLKEKLESLSLTISALTQEKDKLYGSITEVEISKALIEEGIEIDKTKINLEEPIKAVGIYEVPIALHPEVTTKIKVWIVKK